MAKTATKTSTKRSATKTMKKAVSRKGKACEAADGCESLAGEAEVTIDRRRASQRKNEAAGLGETAAAPQLERRQKVNRRRQIDPTTCERDYTEQEVEFMNALDEYKRKSGRMFPTCSEVLEVINSLGYVKLTMGQSMGGQVNQATAASAKPMLGDLQVEKNLEAVIAATEQLL